MKPYPIHPSPEQPATAFASSWMLRSCSPLLPFFCVLLVFAGCAKKQSTTEARPADSNTAVSTERYAPDSTSPIVAVGDTKETSRLWSSSIKAQLKRIEDELVQTKAPQTASDVFADQIATLAADQPNAAGSFQGQSVKVVELTSAENANAIQAATAEFVNEIRERLLLSPNSEKDTVHFKLFGITRDGEHLKTRQRLTSQGTRNGKPVRSYAVVDATWTAPPKDSDEAPRLVGFSMPQLVRTELAKADSPDMFDDIAGQVLGGNPAWAEQLQFGMNTWTRNIERSLSPDFLGYHGIAIGDVNSDDLEDVYMCQPGGLPNLLFLQQADGTLLDVSEPSGVDWLDNSTAALLVDLDNDGDKDLAVATRTAMLLMENDGTGKFTTRTRLAAGGMGYSPTAADYDLDGDLDLLVLRYTGTSSKTGDFPTPHPFHNARNGGANVLLQNQGGFRFADATKQSGLDVENFRFSFAASWEDYDNDGDLDLYIANDFGPNQLFKNEGQRFIDASSESGTQDWGFGMSATWADYDRDGQMDLYVSSMFSGAGNQIVAKTDFVTAMPNETREKYLKMVRGNTLLRNMGAGHFTDVTNPMSEGFGGWAWGSKFADLNNDGWEDLYVANGYISQPDKDDL